MLHYGDGVNNTVEENSGNLLLTWIR